MDLFHDILHLLWHRFVKSPFDKLFLSLSSKICKIRKSLHMSSLSCLISLAKIVKALTVKR